MGIDIFMSWGTGPSFDGPYEEAYRGGNGHLREAYHGGPYATVVLAPEAFGDPLRTAQAFGMAGVESAAVGTDAEGYAVQRTTRRADNESRLRLEPESRGP
jgi:hypothetical protein